MTNIHQKVIHELQKTDFPDLKFLFSDAVLEEAPKILADLLQIDKQKFEAFLKKKDKETTFDDFEEDSLLDYFWSLLNHLKSVKNSEKIRKIIDDFRPQLEDFSHYTAYNKTYFEKLKYVSDHSKLDEEQKRVMHLSIKAFKERGIDLSEKKQEKLKKINKKLSKISDQFENNVIDDKATFEYIITDFEDIKDLPKEVLEMAEKKYNQTHTPIHNAQK